MTFDTISMTMPSVDCPPSYVAPHIPPRALVLDRIKARISNYGIHGQKCAERYNNAHRVLRANEKRDTALLLQKVQEFKNKKGGKFKTDTSRQKSAIENSDGNESPYHALSRLKRKLQLGGDGDGQGVNNNGYGENSTGRQQEAKKVKHDNPNMANSLRQDCQPATVSVQIVQNFGNEAAKRIETTVNVQSSRNMPDAQSVSVNVGSKNIKQELMNENLPGQQQMTAGNMNPRPAGNPDSGDVGGLSEDDISGDLESVLFELMQKFPEDMMDVLGGDLMTPDGQIQPQTQQMTSQPQHMTSQSQQMTSQSQQMTSPAQHMSSPPQHMSSPGQHMTSQSIPSQMQQQNARMLCKSEKVDMFHGFHGNMTENKQDTMRRNHHSMTQQNISANIMTQQSMRIGTNNFSANMSTQQNISLNMSATQQNNYSSNMRHNIPNNSNNMTANNNNNMTSQHIHRLNQVAVNSQFGPPNTSPEPPRLFHPPAGSQNPQAQSGYYESHSQQLKQLAEKRWGMNGSASVNLTSDIRTSQTFPQYRNNECPPLSQHINMPNHPVVSNQGSQRLSHLDPNMYNRPTQQFQSQRSGTVNMMMQQSMPNQLQHEAVMKQRVAQFQMQNNQTNYYNRIPEQHQQQQQVMQSNPNGPFPNNVVPHPSWNSRAPSWPASSSQNPVHRPQVTSDFSNPMQRPHISNDIQQGSYLPELDMQSSVDLNILNEILSE